MSGKHLKFYGLGSFYFSDGSRVFNGDSWVSKKAMYLFMYLLVERKRKVSSEELVDIFWQQSVLERGKKKLYDTIYLLRKSLSRDGLDKDIVESNNGYYTINSNYKVWTDWDCFGHKTDLLINRKGDFSIQDLKKLFELYRDDFFTDLSYASWTEIYREQLKQKYLNLIEIMSRKMYNAQKYLDALNYLNKGIDYDPYRESFYLLKLKTFNQLGRTAEAINCYKKCKKILDEHLGVAPQKKLKIELNRIKESRDIVEEDIDTNIEEKINFDSGAMKCANINEFKSIFEFELRQVQRIDEEAFLLITLEFEDGTLATEDVKCAFDQIISKFKSIMRLGDYICPAQNRIYLILHDMSLDSSGIIIKRFNKFFDKTNFPKKPKLDIKEIK
ncbi:MULTISPECIES: AfsR/SARP family transcriptional regulator [Halanaerobium]|uniref:Transcriptional activator domain-containing protein n=1 Tax=Halanaerobium kushneri TaxID=56779 RepID=A0A1N6WW86_9FIRM|nr:MULTISPECIES: BTAD domain-containing putative transcriptional regulator [Halanaerobium]RCW62457.1 transcriptional activator [Halanaerobium sp. ST460_2HS_T2]SIQ94374.1 transcriptional activator domain-containing protein [Halanaerobium kushneri]